MTRASADHQTLAVLFAMTALGLVACRSSGRGEILEGEHYLRYTLFSVDGVHRTSNVRPRRRGPRRDATDLRLVPINTKVELLGTGADTIELETADGRRLLVQNSHRQTGCSLWDTYRQVLARKPVDLSEFGEGAAVAIEAGEVLPGMTRKAVLSALGPPPQSGTASLSSAVWKYWRDERTPMFVRFDPAGRVMEVSQ